MMPDMNLTTEYESGYDYPFTARDLVRAWATTGLGVSEDEEFYVVWFCFVLGGWKALVSSTAADGRYYEVTYNRAANEAYVDTYMKTHNNVYKFDQPKED